MNSGIVRRALGIFVLLRNLIGIFEFNQVEEDNRGTIDPNG